MTGLKAMTGRYTLADPSSMAAPGTGDGQQVEVSCEQGEGQGVVNGSSFRGGRCRLCTGIKNGNFR